MLIISDLHFGSLSLNSAEIQNFLKEAYKDPDRLVVIGGDLTQSSIPQEYEQMSLFLKTLLQNKVRVVITVGNHDFGGKLAENFHWLTDTYENSRKFLVKVLQPCLEQKETIARNGLDSITQISNHFFVALCSQHRKAARIKTDQIHWTQNELKKLSLPRSGAYIHLVTHHSIWLDKSADKHRHMDKRKRLVEGLLKPFQFHSFIHGHNHRFTFQNTTTPKTTYRMLRISVPTLSPRNKMWERGYVRWGLETMTSQAELIDLDAKISSPLPSTLTSSFSKTEFQSPSLSFTLCQSVQAAEIVLQLEKFCESENMSKEQREQMFLVQALQVRDHALPTHLMHARMYFLTISLEHGWRNATESMELGVILAKALEPVAVIPWKVSSLIVGYCR